MWGTGITNQSTNYAVEISQGWVVAFSVLLPPQNIQACKLIITFSHFSNIIYIKTHGSESQGQLEAACTRVFWLTQPLQ